MKLHEEFKLYENMWDSSNEDLITLFKQGLEGWSWESWESAGAADKEDVAKYAISELDGAIPEQKVYDAFWNWAHELTEEDFAENLQENSNPYAPRAMKMYCVEVGNDASEFELIFEVDGKIVDRATEYSFDDILITSAAFFKRNCEKVGFDTRFDRLEIKLDYTYYGA
jgi:hypothetical protein